MFASKWGPPSPGGYERGPTKLNEEDYGHSMIASYRNHKHNEEDNMETAMRHSMLIDREYALW